MDWDSVDTSSEDVKKTVTFIRQMEGILRSSSNPGQIERIRKELVKYRAKLSQLLPGLNAHSEDIEEISRSLGLEAERLPSVNLKEPPRRMNSMGAGGDESTDLIDSIAMTKASPHCSDYDINFLSTVLHFLQKEYWPVISEQHCKVDFSHGTVRDTIRNKMDNVMRNLKVLAETIEEYAMADKQDFREQLLKMKNKQSRIFLIETSSVLREVSEFLSELATDVNTSGSIVVNKSDIIEFNPRFEEAEKLKGKTVSHAITEFNSFVKQVLKKINLPEFRKGK